MKNLKEQNPIVLALAIIGIIAILYGGWTVYQHHISEGMENAIRYGPPTAGVGKALKAKPQPPPQ